LRQAALYDLKEKKMDIRNVIQSQLKRVVAEHSPMPFPENIEDDDELDLFGLDSLAFMELLIGVEKELGYIPRTILEGDLYPETFGELVSAYDA
jgi:acyl carrier protein